MQYGLKNELCGKAGQDRHHPCKCHLAVQHEPALFLPVGDGGGRDDNDERCGHKDDMEEKKTLHIMNLSFQTSDKRLQCIIE